MSKMHNTTKKYLVFLTRTILTYPTIAGENDPDNTSHSVRLKYQDLPARYIFLINYKVLLLGHKVWQDDSLME